MRGKHLPPFIYRKQMQNLQGSPEMGDLVRLAWESDLTAGWGLFNPKSERRVRTLVYGAEFPPGFWNDRLTDAVRFRNDFLHLPQQSEAYRVIHAEGDGLPGLMIDRYGDTLSAEVFIPGMLQRIQPLLQELHRLCGTTHHVIRCAPNSLGQEGFSLLPTMSDDCPAYRIVRENSVSFRVEFEDSHKTGFFCDQRENRKQFGELCRGKDVLDLCCYSGGFSIYAAHAQAASVTAVDLDENAIALARVNAGINKSQIKFTHADIFPWMRDLVSAGRTFDVVVLDPPKLIHNRRELEDGRKTHFDMNRLAMQLVAPGGMFLTCSCSGLLGTDEFMKLVCAASQQAGEPIAGDSDEKWPRRGARTMRIFDRTAAGSDHPVAGHSAETRYLDALWCKFD